MINTYNETDLHKFFKEKYAKENQGNQGFTEVKVGEYICDIFTKESSIIEIQTTSLYKLVPKIESLSKNYRTKDNHFYCPQLKSPHNRCTGLINF